MLYGFRVLFKWFKIIYRMFCLTSLLSLMSNFVLLPRNVCATTIIQSQVPSQLGWSVFPIKGKNASTTPVDAMHSQRTTKKGFLAPRSSRPQLSFESKFPKEKTLWVLWVQSAPWDVQNQLKPFQGKANYCRMVLFTSEKSYHLKSEVRPLACGSLLIDPLWMLLDLASLSLQQFLDQPKSA